MWRAIFPSALVLLGLLGRLGYAAGNAEKPPAGKPLHVKVRAVDALGMPIARAVIAAWQSGGGGRSWWTARRIAVNGGNGARTGKNGWAAISLSLEPNPATYQGPRVGFCLTAQAEGYLVTRSGRIDATPSDHFEVVLTLRRLLSVEGRVVDQRGRPVAGAAVFHTGNATPRTEARTDAHGHFRIGGLPEGKTPLFVAHPGYHFHGQLADTSAGPQELKVLAADQTPAPLRTLPPLRTREEELKMARQVIRPLWEAAMKSTGDGGKEWCCESYAPLEPWVAYDYVNAHLSKASRNRFVSWKMPLLYAADPEEALAVLESLDEAEYMKAFALLGTVRETPGLSPEQKLELLDRATQHLRATIEPDERVFRLSAVAVRLFKLGKTAEARKLVETVAPAAKQLLPKTNAAACATVGEALSLFDRPAGLRLIYSARNAGDEYYWVPALFHVAYGIARQQPAEAERLAAEAIQFATRSWLKTYQEEHHRDPTDEESAGTLTWYEIRLVPLCYDLVSIDAARAERVAATIQNPYLRAYAVGMMAKALASTDKPRARRLILRAYDGLADACRNPDRRWPRDSWRFSPPIVAAGLLPVVERIDPTLVGEFLWRALSYRLPRSADDCLVSLEPERNDATLAAFAARYDRGLARALLPPVDKTIVPAPAWGDDSYWIPMFAMTDVNEALEKLRAGAASPGAEAGQCLQNAFFLMQMLPIDGSHRWDFYAMNNCGLWNPDNQYYAVGSYAW
jgi:hypothetical protein